MERSEAQRLSALARYAIAGTPPEPNFDRITLLGAKVFGSSFCTLNLVEDERLWVKSRFGIDVDQLPRSMSFCDYTIRGDDIMVVNNAVTDRRFAQSPIVAGEPNIRFYAGAPLITSEGDRIGTLCLLDQRPTSAFSSEDATVLRNLAATAMELIEARSREMQLAELTREASHQAHHDALTGLANRRDLIVRVEEMARWPIPGERMALLYIDLDGFKAVNDAHGHLVGDQLLVQVAERLRQGLRITDCLARVGGDEFVMILRGDKNVVERAQIIAERLIDRIAAPFVVSGAMVFIGASIGVTIETVAGATLDEMLQRADTMLYQAKSNGKGQFAIAPDGTVEPPPTTRRLSLVQ